MISYNEEVNNKTLALINELIEALNTGIIDDIMADFIIFIELGLFSNQLEEIKKALDNLKKSLDSFSEVLQENKREWDDTDNGIGVAIGSFGDIVNGSGNVGGRNRNGGGSFSGGSSSGGNSSGGGSSGGGNSSGGSTSSGNGIKVSSINHGVSVSTSSVKDIVGRLDDSTTPILVQKLYNMNNKKSIVDLLVDDSKSGELLVLLKKVLGDTTEDLTPENTLESSEIQKEVLRVLKIEDVDFATEEGKEQIEKVVLENINNSTVDQEKWNELIYGDNTYMLNILDGDWVVAKTNQDLLEYASYISSQGVRQNSDTSKYSDYCLAFSYVHAYDLYTGARDTAVDAGNYAHAGSFHDYIDDDINKVLSVVYDEIMNGRPVVLQVNGNKKGTSRHFVTVVGFKAGVTSADSLTQQDLLIIDSWDGKIERMDTDTSRFMTTGAACGKDYSGYRLRVLNS